MCMLRAKSLQLCPTWCDPMNCSLPVSFEHGNSPGRNIGVGCHALLQGIFLTQGLNVLLFHTNRFSQIIGDWSALLGASQVAQTIKNAMRENWV